MSAVRSFVRELRKRAGLSQGELAARVSLSRQSLSAIEAGTAVPSTTVALALGRALGCRVEELFALDAQDAPLAATLAPALAPAVAPVAGSRVRVGLVQDRWIAHGLEGDDPAALITPADGIVARGRRRDKQAAAVSPLRDLDDLRANVLVAGCDPALGLLAGHLIGGNARVRLHWLAAASSAALDAFASGLVHAAGLHIFDASSGEYNVPAVRARLGDRPVVLVNLASWEQGFVVRKGSRIRHPADLASRGVRLVVREPGSGAQSLLERLLAGAGIPRARLSVAETVHGHHAVAHCVAHARGDVGVATAAAAAAFGLDFIPLSEDRFDLVFLADTVQGASGQRLLEILASGRFKRDVGALPGYGTKRTGQIIARLAS